MAQGKGTDLFSFKTSRRRNKSVPFSSLKMLLCLGSFNTCIIIDIFHPSNDAVFKAHLDPVWMGGRLCQDILNDTLRQPSRTLVLFRYHLHKHARLYICSLYPLNDDNISLKFSSPASIFSMISEARVSGSGRLSKSARDLSFSHVMSRLVLSRLMISLYVNLLHRPSGFVLLSHVSFLLCLLSGFFHFIN